MQSKDSDALRLSKEGTGSDGEESVKVRWGSGVENPEFMTGQSEGANSACCHLIQFGKSEMGKMYFESCILSCIHRCNIWSHPGCIARPRIQKALTRLSVIDQQARHRQLQS